MAGLISGRPALGATDRCSPEIVSAISAQFQVRGPALPLPLPPLDEPGQAAQEQNQRISKREPDHPERAARPSLPGGDSAKPEIHRRHPAAADDPHPVARAVKNTVPPGRPFDFKLPGSAGDPDLFVRFEKARRLRLLPSLQQHRIATPKASRKQQQRQPANQKTQSKNDAGRRWLHKSILPSQPRHHLPPGAHKTQ